MCRPLGWSANKLGVLSNGMWQKSEVIGASDFLGQGSTEVLAGLGSSEHPDVVRMLWPTSEPKTNSKSPQASRPR